MAALGQIPHIDVMGTDYPTHDGSAIRDYVHVSDLADAHVAALRRLLAGGSGGAFNLGTGRGSSVKQTDAFYRLNAGEKLLFWGGVFGLGLLVVASGLLLSGVFAANIFGQWWLKQGDRLLTQAAFKLDMQAKLATVGCLAHGWHRVQDGYGVLVQDHVEVPHTTTAAGREEGAEPGPIQLQGHGNPLQFRNIWIVAKK